MFRQPSVSVQELLNTIKGVLATPEGVLATPEGEFVNLVTRQSINSLLLQDMRSVTRECERAKVWLTEHLGPGFSFEHHIENGGELKVHTTIGPDVNTSDCVPVLDRLLYSVCMDESGGWACMPTRRRGCSLSEAIDTYSDEELKVALLKIEGHGCPIYWQDVSIPPIALELWIKFIKAKIHSALLQKLRGDTRNIGLNVHVRAG